MDRKAFFDVMRLEFGPLNQPQVDGTNQLLDSGQHRLIPLEQLAYILATSWHETAATMQPIAEYGKGKGKKYGVPTEYNGQVAYGRGYVQLTWDYNYERADAALRLSGALLSNFDLALDPAIAANIIFEGMLGGWFTSKALGHYVTADGSKVDYVNARRVVNGTDCADKIANHARDFQGCLELAAYDPHEVFPEDVMPPEPEPPDVVVEPPPVDPPLPEVPPVPPVEPPPTAEIEPPPEVPGQPSLPWVDRPLDKQTALALLALVGLGVLVTVKLKDE